MEPENTTEILNDTQMFLPHYLIYTPKSTSLLIFYYIISVIGIPGNILTITVIARSRSLRNKPINIILAHQAMVDVIVCFFTIAEETVAIIDSIDVMTPFICHYMLTKTTSNVCYFISTYNMVILSLERHFAIVDPLSYDPDKVKRRLPYFFVAEWILCYAAFAIVPGTTRTINGMCLMGHNMLYNWISDMYSPYEMTIAFVIPLFISFVCYSRMFYYLNKSARGSGDKKLQESTSSNVDKLRMAQMNIFKTCLTVIVVFFLCWVTTESHVFMYLLGFYDTFSNTHYFAGNLSVILNSCLNPYIYAIRYDDFKKELRVMFSKK